MAEYLLDVNGDPIGVVPAHYDEDESQRVVWVTLDDGQEVMYRDYHPKAKRLIAEAEAVKALEEPVVRHVVFGPGKAPEGFESGVEYTVDEVADVLGG